MIFDRTKCPLDPEEAAEEYIMGRLPEAHRVAFEQHLLTCGACRRAVERTGEYIRAMRSAAQRLGS